MHNPSIVLWSTVANHQSRRAALRLLAGSVLAAVMTRRGIASTRAAQRPDRDGDGLYDDDETDVYGTDPDNPDTDGDGIDDGQEVFDGTDPLTPNGGGAPPPGSPDGGVDCTVTPEQCGIVPAPPAGTILTDVACDSGLANCDGYCVDLSTNDNHCGACGNFCGYGGNCEGGRCAVAACPTGQVVCDVYCEDLRSSVANCGACGNRCAEGLVCCYGACVDIASDPRNCGGCGSACFDQIGTESCSNYRCS